MHLIFWIWICQTITCFYFNVKKLLKIKILKILIAFCSYFLQAFEKKANVYVCANFHIIDVYVGFAVLINKLLWIDTCTCRTQCIWDLRTLANFISQMSKIWIYPKFSSGGAFNFDLGGIGKWSGTVCKRQNNRFISMLTHEEVYCISLQTWFERLRRSWSWWLTGSLLTT